MVLIIGAVYIYVQKISLNDKGGNKASQGVAIYGHAY